MVLARGPVSMRSATIDLIFHDAGDMQPVLDLQHADHRDVFPGVCGAGGETPARSSHGVRGIVTRVQNNRGRPGNVSWKRPVITTRWSPAQFVCAPWMAVFSSSAASSIARERRPRSRFAFLRAPWGARVTRWCVRSQTCCPRAPPCGSHG